MTEQEYDEQIAPVLAGIAQRVQELGGSMVARVEWEGQRAGITHIGIENSSVSQKLTDLAALCKGNFDLLYIEAAKKFDMSQTIVGRLMDPTPSARP